MNIHLLIMARPISKLEDIERTAIRLFASRGLAQVTVKLIAEEANCAEGSLYRYYRSKEEMAWKLFRREVEQFGSRLQKILKSPVSFSSRIKTSIELFYKFFDEDRDRFSFILLAQHDFPREWQIRKEFNPDFLVIDFIRQGMQQGVMRIEDATLGAAMVLGLVLQAATQCAKGRLKGPLLQKAKEIEGACIAVLGLRERTKRRSS